MSIIYIYKYKYIYMHIAFTYVVLLKGRKVYFFNFNFRSSNAKFNETFNYSNTINDLLTSKIPNLEFLISIFLI